MRRYPAAGFALLCSLFYSSAGWAQPSATEQAKTLFDAGAQAYEAGNFPAALQAFESAYKLSPRPGIVFSMAQAHRRQYYIAKRPENLRSAINYYREYVGRVEQGGRRGEAAQALAELEPLSERLEKTPAEPKAPLEIKPETRLMVLSKVGGASISVDGEKAQPMPLFAEVKPGKHTLRISAEGHLSEDREVEVREGLVVTLDVPLREKPGSLSIEGADGANLTIDERTIGVLPLPKPLELTAGRYLVTVTKNGHKAFAEEIDLGRGKPRALPIQLKMTGQRLTSYVMFVASGGALATGIVLAVLAASTQPAAEKIYERAQTQGGVPPADLATYNEALDKRDRFRTYSTAVTIGSFLVGATGLAFYLFDQPDISAARRRVVEKPQAPAPSSPRETPMEVSAAPLLGPGFYGASLHGRF